MDLAQLKGWSLGTCLCSRGSRDTIGVTIYYSHCSALACLLSRQGFRPDILNGGEMFILIRSDR